MVLKKLRKINVIGENKMNMLIVEVFDRVKAAKSRDEKIKILKQNDTLSLRQILYANFSDKIMFLIPETPAKFKPSVCPLGLADTNLFRETSRLYLFIRGGHATLQQLRREQLWVQLLEGVAKEEAVLLEFLKNKKLGDAYDLTADVVLAAFPNLQIPCTVPAQEAIGSVSPVSPVLPAEVSGEAILTEAGQKRKRGRPRKVLTQVLPNQLKTEV